MGKNSPQSKNRVVPAWSWKGGGPMPSLRQLPERRLSLKEIFFCLFPAYASLLWGQRLVSIVWAITICLALLVILTTNFWGSCYLNTNLLMKKQRHREEVEWLPSGLTVSKQWPWVLSPGLLDSQTYTFHHQFPPPSIICLHCPPQSMSLFLILLVHLVQITIITLIPFIVGAQ